MAFDGTIARNLNALRKANVGWCSFESIDGCNVDGLGGFQRVTTSFNIYEVWVVRASIFYIIIF